MSTTKQMKDAGLFVYRQSYIVFGGKSAITAPQRNSDLIDEYDIIFPNAQEFRKWFDQLQINLAELDKPMNFCAYFERTKGNDGFYVRDGKRFPVQGTWDGQHLRCLHTENKGFVCCSMKPFAEFLNENGWENTWFALRDSYVVRRNEYTKIPVLKVQLL